MSIKVSCGGCGRTMTAKDSAAGKRASCPDCGAIVEIPFPDDEPIYDDVMSPASSQAAPGGNQPDSGERRPSAGQAVRRHRQRGTAGSDETRKRVPCPQCGEMIIKGAAKCRFCGSYFSDQRRGPWRDDSQLVFRKDARLPMKCVKTNEPCQRTLSRKLRWHPPLLYVLVLFGGPLLYVIVALIVSKRATIELPLTDKWFSRRLQAILVAWGTIIFSGIMFCSGLSMADGGPGGNAIGVALTIGSVLLALLGAIFGIVRARIVTPSRITDTHVWLKGARREYLAALPEWDSRLI